jgi:hypothetical protein
MATTNKTPPIDPPIIGPSGMRLLLFGLAPTEPDVGVEPASSVFDGTVKPPPAVFAPPVGKGVSGTR